jgi:Spy/CpxP family protein refolding chaperone
MKKKIGIVLAAVLAVGTVTAIAAEAAGHHGRHMRGEMFVSQKEMESRLNLTADQKTKLDQMRTQERGQMKGMREAARADHQALMQELWKDSPNQAEIQRLTASMAQRQSEMMNQHVQAMLAFSQSLTPEQRTQMQQLMAEKQQKRAAMRQKWEQRRQQKQQDATPSAPPNPQQ